MKIAYISSIFFSDVDLSYLQEAQKHNDIYWIILLGLETKGMAINIENPYSHSGLYKAMDIYSKEFGRFRNLVDLDRVYVLNNRDKNGFSRKTLWCQLCLLLFLTKNKFSIIQITHIPRRFERWLYLFRKKLIQVVHDPFSHSCHDGNALLENNRKWAFRTFQNFVIFNEAQKFNFIEHYQMQSKNIFDSRLSRYTYLRIYDTQKFDIQKCYVLFFGQIHSSKGIEYLLSAMKFVHKQNPDVELIIAGRGQIYFDYSPYINSDYIHLYNRFIPDDELATLIANSEFVVVPYKDATQSGVIMSAFAFNKPVIATNVGGLPEMVIDGEMGKIIPPCDVEALAIAMNEFLGDKGSLKRCSDAIEKEYSEGEKSWKQIAEKMNDYYYQVYNPNS